ncbi:uncharacterized protein TRAVEDRAFT_20813 [Trametes versicolor FP-101664 SS1]|uniref:uncharacterized protein n=1 Tax=Trametes versicolor (strain FP-101664) TaxID=717944 RepID=UPI0004623153|nr:uncharacterized protein TRAVEDRAFT_20813 [Trametes versicolor FP-101664 SS1]EIW59012.1 hypothetical protein TRAVEDRAFT_20813 [Trametes versicolor FP-101664 SS1]
MTSARLLQLANLFYAHLPDVANVDTPRLRWIPCLQVCRHWYSVGASNPRLWSFLWADTSLNYIRTCLARSKCMKIDVHVSKKTSIVSHVLPLLVPHIHRIRTLYLLGVARDEAPRLAVFMKNTLPALETFQARVGNYLLDTSEDSVLDCTPERFPKLTCVDISGIHLLQTTALRQLKVLRLYGWLGIGAVPARTLGIFLQELVGVEDLLLSSMLFRIQSDPDWKPARAPLPRLRNLELDASEDEVLQHILSAFAIPTTTTTLIHRRVTTIVTRGIEEALLRGVRATLPVDRTGLPILSCASMALVRALRDVHTVEVFAPLAPFKPADGRIRLSLEIPNSYQYEDGGSLLEDFVDICRGAPIEVLRIDIEPSWCHLIDWRETFVPFTVLHELTISGEGVDPQATFLFSGLDPRGTPAATPDGERLILPQLQKLCVEGFDAHDWTLLPAVVECLRHRREALGVPIVLERLSFELSGHRTVRHYHEQRALYTDALSEYVLFFSYGLLRDDFSKLRETV